MLHDFIVYPHLLDAVCFFASCAMFLVYLRFIRSKSRNNPAYTVQGISSLARLAWVKSVMEEGKDILAVQTLRNSTMASTFLASTAILLAGGVLTLLAQSDKLRIAWQTLNFIATEHESVLPVKLVILLVDLFAAFFFFASSIRYYNHVGYMINAPYTEAEKVMSPRVVAGQLNRAAHHYRMGLRGFYTMVPLVFWIFGPLFLFFSTIAMIMIVSHLDRTPPTVEQDFHRECDGAACFLADLDDKDV